MTTAEQDKVDDPRASTVKVAPERKDTGRIIRIDTWRWESQPNCLWVEVVTDRGVTGLGETYYHAGATEAIVHDMVAPLLLGADASAINRHWRDVFACQNFSGFAGSEMRAYSAIDVALWDALAQLLECPLYVLLGGAVTDRISVYATCADAGAYQDQRSSLESPGELAEELLSRDIRAMKIWPFDRFAPQILGRYITGPAGWSAMGPPGHYLTASELQKGTDVLGSIRDRVGTKMAVILEGHSRWDLNTAVRIAQAVEPYDITWMEDFIQPDSVGDLARLAGATSVPQAVSERLIGRYRFREVLEAAAARVVMLDVTWTGGISEAARIADLADTYHLPFAPHDCTGPVTVLCNVHLATAKPNFMITETVRGFCEGYYLEVLDTPIEIVNGAIPVPTRPGLGAALSAQFKARPGVTRRSSE